MLSRSSLPFGPGARKGSPWPDRPSRAAQVLGGVRVVRRGVAALAWTLAAKWVKVTGWADKAAAEAVIVKAMAATK